jgi:RNA polymerase sigma-70 factor, ECF subfamily
MTQERDLELIEKFKSGDKSAFEELYERYKRKIMNYLSRMINDRAAAEDLTQETMVKVYMKIDMYKPVGTFSSWVYAIARNLGKNEFRRLGKAKIVSFDSKLGSESENTLADIIKSDDYDAYETIQNDEINDEIQHVLSAMPIKYREVITLCLVQGLSNEEASQVLKCSKDSIAVKLSRARKLFASIVTRMG